MKPVIVTKELASEGLTVMRGRDWCYTAQDGTAGNKGEITYIGNPDGWCTVQWEGGNCCRYRIGYLSSYDLYVYLPGFYDPKPSGKQVLTKENFKIGLVVELNNQATNFARERLKGKGKLVISGGGFDVAEFAGITGGYKFQSFDICEDQTVTVDKPQSVSYTEVPSVQKSVPAEKPIYKFRKGDVVYIRPEKQDSWTRNTGVRENVPYNVVEVEGTTMKVIELVHWQLQDQFVKEEEWLRSVFAQRKLDTMPIMTNGDLQKVQKSVVAIAENSKPNIKHDGNNNKHPEPFKVRRPISTIQGPKGRSGAVYPSGRSSSGSRISNY